MTEEAREAEDPTVALVARFRAEHAAQEDKAVQALLLHECGVLEELRGEEPVAARDYLAAFNADPQFREPLEALVRILTRRKSIKNLGKLLDALARASSSPEERARALWERAAFIETHENNLPAAKELLEEAIGQTAEDPALWLELELLAGKQGDSAGRMRALEARAELAIDPTWKALLFVDLAELSAAAGETARAYELLGTAAALEGQARFRTQVVLEQLARSEDNVETLARALEGQADLIEEAIDDPEAGDANGVPRYVRKAEYAADAWFRAAEVKRRTGDAASVAGMLDRAGSRLPESSAIARARLVALEAAGEASAAAAIARAELERGVSGAGAASLWLRVAEAAALGNDRAAALGALRNGLSTDPASIPARALLLDLLGDGQDPAALAAALESSADSFTTDEAKGRIFLLAAYVWAAQADDVPAARTALSQASACGVPAPLVSRVARMFAALKNDATWFEESTKRLLAAGAEAAEQPSLWFELARSRLLRGDEAGAGEAFTKLAGCDGEPAAWLGRVLGALALGLREKSDGARPPRAADALDELAKVESDPLVARGLRLVAALRSARAGQLDAARDRLRALHEAVPSDEVTAIYLSELDRKAGDAVSAAAVLSACATASEDGDFSAALHLEAAILLFRAHQHEKAVEALEAARGRAPRAGATMLNWALRGADAETLEGRRRALDVAAEAGDDPAGVALERFGLEAALGAPNEALAALDLVEKEGTDELAIAAALGRLVWPPAVARREAVERALDELEECGDDAAALARAERFRLTREDQDRPLAASRAAAWAEAEPSLPVAIEWLGAALAAEDRDAEVSARRAAAVHFEGSARAALEASAAAVASIARPGDAHPFIAGVEVPGQLMNLELAPPGCDVRRRASALRGLGTALGDDPQLDAIAMAGWSELAAGRADEAREAFRTVLEERKGDIACWEGVRAASEALGDHVQQALSCAQLGSFCKSAERGAEFWEAAGVILLEHTDAKDDAEIAFERAFSRDPRRVVAFDKLFRAVRSRNEDERLLTIIAKRLEVSEDEAEIGKLYWERARVLRKKGELDAALSALENVTMLEPDHVGALALSGEICISKGAFGEAAPFLARLATIEEAPRQQRLMSGIAAVDLFENKLGAPDKALDVLLKLNKAGLATLPVRERLARVAARAGAWGEATSILELLMNERDKAEGRIEAARLGMSIWRDKLNVPVRAQSAVERLLSEAPDDPEGVAFVLDTPGFDQNFRVQALGRAKATLIQSLASSPTDAARVELLSRIAEAGNDAPLRQATLGALIALGKASPTASDELMRLDGRVAARPQVVLDETALREIADPDDYGPVAELFVAMSETIALAVEPSLASHGVTKKDKVEARGGHPLRVAVSEWMGAVGLAGDFDLYIGGRDPHGAAGIAGEQPALVVGAAVGVPLDATARTGIAREVFALRRGITSLRSRDENTVASIVAAACIEAGIPVAPPPYAVFGEVSRSIKKEMSRKVRKAIVEICQRVMQGGDPRAWALAAQRSLDRVAVIAAGDVSIVLADLLHTPRERLGGHVVDNERARRLLAFVLSPSYLELRKKLGMGVR